MCIKLIVGFNQYLNSEIACSVLQKYSDSLQPLDASKDSITIKINFFLFIFNLLITLIGS